MNSLSLVIKMFLLASVTGWAYFTYEIYFLLSGDNKGVMGEGQNVLTALVFF